MTGAEMATHAKASFVQRAAALIDAELFERRDTVNEELNHVKAKSPGYLDTGGYYRCISQLLSTELQTRAELIWRYFVQAHKSFGAELTGTLRGHLKRACKAQIRKTCVELQSLLDAEIKAPADRRRFSLDEKLKHALSKYSVEIDMYVDALERNETRESETRSAGPVAPVTDLAQPLQSKITDSLADNQNRFVLEGDYWSITFNGTTKRFKNTKGMRYIEHLIRNQGIKNYVYHVFIAVNPLPPEAINELHATLPAAQWEQYGLSVSNPPVAGEIADSVSKMKLKEYWEELCDQIEDAQALGDDEKQAKLEEEKEKFEKYLAANWGLGGRARKTLSPIEQLRKNVTNCIRRDIGKIESVYPELAHHLRCIKTGTFCQYAPHPKAEWLLKPR